MAKDAKYIVLVNMLDAHVQGTILSDRDLRGQSERLVKNGALREATAAEVKAFEDAVAAGEPVPFTAGAPLGYPNPNDDPKGEIAAATRQAEIDGIVDRLSAVHTAALGDLQTKHDALEAENKRLVAENAKLKKDGAS